MTTKKQLLEEGYLTQSDMARLLRISKQAVSQEVQCRYINSETVKGWGSPVIPADEACRVMRERDMTQADIAGAFYRVGEASGWGKALIVGLIALGLGVLFLGLKR